MIAASWSELFKQLEGLEIAVRGYPYNYQDLPMLRLYVYATIKRIVGFKTLHKHLSLRPDVLVLVGLQRVPHRKTISERFRALPEVVLSLVDQLTEQFMNSAAIDPSIGSVDSTLMQANGNIWHSQQMQAGELPSCGNVDTQAHWGVSGCGEWVFGYRLHCLTLCGPSGVTWPATVAIHPANIKDAKVFDDELSPHLPSSTKVLLGDGGYAYESCFLTCHQRQISLIAPVEIKKNTPAERIEWAKLYLDPNIREVFALRKTTVEPFQGQLKALFALEYLPCKGLANVRALCCFAVLSYILLMAFNLTHHQQAAHIKDILLALP